MIELGRPAVRATPQVCEVALAPLGRLAGGCPLLGCRLLAGRSLLRCCLLRGPEPSWLRPSSRAGAFFAAAFFCGPEPSWLRPSSRAGAFFAAAFFLRAGAFFAAAFFCGPEPSSLRPSCGRSLLRCCLLASRGLLGRGLLLRAGAFLAAAFFFFAGATRSSSVSWCTGSLAVPARHDTWHGQVDAPARGVERMDHERVRARRS